MFGRSPFIIFIGLCFLGVIISTAMPALADETYLLDKDFQRSDSNIVIHLIQVNVTDKYMGNVYPSNAPEDTKWAHLVYQYENTGDTQEVGHIQYALIDSKGNVYPFNPNLDEYSGVIVAPHSKSDVRWNEIPVPKDTVFTQVHVWEGTNPTLLLANETYDLTLVSTTPTPVATPNEPTSGLSGIERFGCCAPLAPFLIIGSLAVAGVYVRGRGIKK